MDTQLRPQHSNICWHDDGQRCNKRHRQSVQLLYGCAQSASRWFWVVSRAPLPGSNRRFNFYGWTDSEAASLAEMYQTLIELADAAEAGEEDAAEAGEEIVAIHDPDYIASAADWWLKDFDEVCIPN